ncbi:phosphatase PAP2 family protein [Pseudodonghicola flavimaris]|uniref:Phosphatase PAP2 family protein n=1 Tax=Pseudodonghicola flavimaris TaxID=3050036 RepID=A0ABT7EXT8_9RHOB|nr:phosphatase PAP2 family protein [Pseudodonghicola flavimaris]MDK3017090.1 phosphatase PAP2 family protein [Pseudodonghicola flavimaris]
MTSPSHRSLLTDPANPDTLFAGRPWLRRVMRRFGVYIMMAIVMVAFGLSDRKLEHIGDNVQIAVPLAGLACAAATGDGVRYFGRFLLLSSTYNTSKRLLGEAPINIRPNGGTAGFPSGHTAATVFGASWLVNSCLTENRVAKGIAILSAGFVGGSRIAVGAHNIWQVLAGAVLGWMVQCLALVWFDRLFSRGLAGAGRLIRLGAQTLYRALRQGLAQIDPATRQRVRQPVPVQRNR